MMIKLPQWAKSVSEPNGSWLKHTYQWNLGP